VPRPRRTNKRLVPLSNQSSGPSLVVFLFLVWVVEKSCLCNLFSASSHTLSKRIPIAKNAVVHGWGMKGVTVVPSFFVVPSYPNQLRKVNDHITSNKSLVFLSLLSCLALSCSFYLVSKGTTIVSASLRHILQCCPGCSRSSEPFRLQKSLGHN